MTESKEPSKYEEVDLLISSIDHLKDSQQKLAVIAQAAKERREKALTKPSTATPPPQQPPSPTSALTAQPSPAPSAAGTLLQEPNTVPLNTAVESNIEIADVVDSLKVSKDAIAHEEFHGLHSK